MESLIDSMNTDLWEEKNASEIEGFTEYQIMRQHKNIDPTTLRYLIQPSADADPVAATCSNVLKGKDPIKNIGTCALKLDESGNVVAINLDGDCVVKKA